MSTYYKYDPAERGLAINWANVASGISKKLTDEAKRREELKSKIDADTRSLEKVLNENVQGQSERASEFSLDFANQASEVMLLQQRLLKSGQLNIRDYTIQRQNLLDSTNEVFEVAQQFQDEYERRMERAKGSKEFGTSAQFEQYLMDTIGSFADLNQSAAVVNPEDGNVSLGLKVKNPQTGLVTINQDPNNLRAVSSLRQNLMQDYDMYDIDPVTDKFIASSGNWDTVIREKGSRTMKGVLQTITSQTKKSYTLDELMDMGLTEAEAQELLDSGLNPYLEAENDLISEITNNSFNAASILTDTVGGYKFTRDKKAADADDKLIYVEDGPNGMLIPSLSEDQMEVVENTIRNNIRNKENRKIATTVVADYTQRSQTEIDAANEQTAKVDMLTAWFELGYGTEAEQEAAREYILGTEAAKEAGLANMEFFEVKDDENDPNKVTAIDIKFTYVGKDGEPAQKDITKRFNIDGQDSKQWGRFGSEVVPGLDIRTANRVAEEYSGRDFTNPSIVGGGRKPSRATNRELEIAAARQVRNNLQEIEDDFNDDLNADEVAELVAEQLAGTGFEVGYIEDDYKITIKHTATGAETEIDSNNGVATREAIDTFVSNHVMAKDLRRTGFVPEEGGMGKYSVPPKDSQEEEQ